MTITDCEEDGATASDEIFIISPNTGNLDSPDILKVIVNKELFNLLGFNSPQLAANEK
ncbi:MAG: hypothetical protein O7D86_13275 [Proteobacteria bacterium]|nr:hypothetical protein [Pseudomonadota bacterium]